MSKRANKTTLEKIKDFISYNWWSMSILYASAAIFMIYSNNVLVDENIEINKLIREHISGITLLAPDGRAVSVERELVSAEMDAFKNNIMRILVDYIPFDMKDINKNYTKEITKDEAMIFKSSEKIKYFAKHYLAEDAFGKTKYKEYLTHLLEAINNDSFPENVVVYKSEVLSYDIIGGDHFNIKIKVHFDANAYYIEEDKYIQSKSDVTISARGNYDFSKSTQQNPLGIKIIAFTEPIIDKRAILK